MHSKKDAHEKIIKHLNISGYSHICEESSGSLTTPINSTLFGNVRMEKYGSNIVVAVISPKHKEGDIKEIMQ